jgi:hypothetical protein
MRNRILFAFLLLSLQVMSQELYMMPSGVVTGMSSFENINGLKGKGGINNQAAKGSAFEPLSAGTSKILLDIKGAGTIQRMWFTFRERTPEMLRSLRLQIYWDGSAKPAVDVPFGDFFSIGTGHMQAFESALFSSPEGRSFNCYIPMPFRTGAKLVLINESSTNETLLFFDIDFVRLDVQPAAMLYFHAYWHRQRQTVLGKDFEILPAINGKGRFLGCNLVVNADPAYGKAWFGEGEVKMYIDGDSKYPTINGTGTEDYIGTGWGQGPFFNRYQGCSYIDTAKQQYGFYRFHIPDQVLFYSNCKVTIQEMGGEDLQALRVLYTKGARLQPVSVNTDTGFIRLMNPQHHPVSLNEPVFPDGWVNFYRSDDYASTAYFYLDQPQSNLPLLVQVKERLP